MTVQEVAVLMAAHFCVGDSAATDEIPQSVWDDLTERGLLLHGRDETGEGTVALNKDGFAALKEALRCSAC